MTGHQVLVSTVVVAASIELHSAYRDGDDLEGTVACHLLLSGGIGGPPRLWKEWHPPEALSRGDGAAAFLGDHQEQLERRLVASRETEDRCTG